MAKLKGFFCYSQECISLLSPSVLILTRLELNQIRHFHVHFHIESKICYLTNFNNSTVGEHVSVEGFLYVLTYDLG